MPRLKSRQHFIPTGFQFHEPLTNWRAPKNQSFAALVDQVIAHRKGNPGPLAGKSVDPETVANEVDTFNAVYCQRMGWTQYVLHDPMPGGQPAKKAMRPPMNNQSAKRAAAVGAVKSVTTVAKGALNLAQLFGPSEKPVVKTVAEQRAMICAVCPENDKGDWTRYFTEPAALGIRKIFGFVNDSNLITTRDKELGICKVCQCPLRLKVWPELEFIRAHTDAETMAALPYACWIKSE